jgi:hypothetical protein
MVQRASTLGGRKTGPGSSTGAARIVRGREGQLGQDLGERPDRDAHRARRGRLHRGALRRALAALGEVVEQERDDEEVDAVEQLRDLARVRVLEDRRRGIGIAALNGRRVVDHLPGGLEAALLDIARAQPREARIMRRRRIDMRALAVLNDIGDRRLVVARSVTRRRSSEIDHSPSSCAPAGPMNSSRSGTRRKPSAICW